jgi:phospholipid transport system substrate-binding protein
LHLVGGPARIRTKIDVISLKRKMKNTPCIKYLLATDKKPEVKIDWRVYTKNPNKPL